MKPSTPGHSSILEYHAHILCAGEHWDLVAFTPSACSATGVRLPTQISCQGDGRDTCIELWIREAVGSEARES